MRRKVTKKKTMIVPQIMTAEMKLILEHGGWKKCPHCQHPYFTIGDLMKMCEECAEKELIAQLDAGEYEEGPDDFTPGAYPAGDPT